MTPGSAGTAGDRYRVPPREGRHRAPVRLWPTAVGAAVVGLAGLTAAANATAPHVQPDTATALPSPEPSYPTARGADIAPGPLALPTIVPSDAPVWVEDRGRVIVNGRPLRTPTVVPVQAAAPAIETTPTTAMETTSAGTTSSASPTPTETPTPSIGAPTPTADPTVPPLVEIIDATISPEPTPEPTP